MRQLFFILSTLLFISVVMAFAPTESSLPTIYNEVLSVYDNPQNIYSESEMNAIGRDNFKVMVNPYTGIPHKIIGLSLEIENFDNVTDSNIEQYSTQFIENNSYLFKIKPEDFEFHSAKFRRKYWYVKYQQKVNDVLVYNSYLTFRISFDGKVPLLGSDYIPSDPISTIPTISENTAINIAKEDLSKAGISLVENGVISNGLIVYPYVNEKEYNLRLSYSFIVKSDDPIGEWEYFIDADTGEILHRINSIRTLIEGTVEGWVKPNYNDDASVIVVYPNIRVTVDGSSINADLAGNWSLDRTAGGNYNFSGELEGYWVDVHNEDSSRDASVSTSFSTTPFEYIWGSTDAEIDERTVYHTVNYIHDYWKEGMDFDDMDFQMDATVKVGDAYDNAYYSGADRSINFGEGGSYFYNLALQSDVVYHEYTHAVTHEIYASIPYTGQSGALDEAFSDYFPCSITDEPYMGERLYRGDISTYMRTCSNTNRYPINYTDEVHHDAMIATGAFWEIRAELGAGECDTLVHFARFANPLTYEDMLWEIAAEDDDDADLGNGTPNALVIFDAFYNHGIGPGTEMTVEHTPISDSEDPTEVHEGSFRAYSLATVDESVSYLSYSTDDGSTWNDLDVSYRTLTNRFHAYIPAQPIGTTVLYYFHVENHIGQVRLVPTDGSSDPLSFFVGYDEEAPVIIHTAMPDQTPILWPAVILCDATDNGCVNDVYCELKVNSVVVPTVELSYTGEGNRWRGEIGCEIHIGDVVEYRLRAVDNALAENTTFSPDGEWYSFDIVDTYYEPFEYEYCPYTTDAPSEGFGNQWHVSTFRNTTPDGTTSYKCGSPDPDETYSDRVDAVLLTPVFNFDTNTRLYFWNWMRSETSGADPSRAYDGGLVEMREEDGEWFIITPESGYTHTIRNTSETCALPHDTPCFAGDYNWTMAEFDLGAYSGRYQLRWRFASDRAVEEEGWYVDEITIISEGFDLSETVVQKPENTSLSAYPNPFNSSCSIKLPENAKGIEILDTKGNAVLKETIVNSTNFTWRPQNIESGVYIVKIIGQENSSKNLIYLK